VLCGDVANSPVTLNGAEGPGSGRYAFLELIGFDCGSLEAALDRVSGGMPGIGTLDDAKYSLAAHAVYSTSAHVIQQAKEWCRARGRVFGMHVAEHEPEMEFLQTGGGFCRELLQSLGRWVEGWAPPGMSPVAYLDSLGVLDEKTLLVHGVHCSGSDWDRVASRGCTVCFCPRSNENIGAGRPDIGRAIRMGVPTALGTDSLASNVDLNLFAEAAFVLDRYPELGPDALIAMMTLGGARALGLEVRLGSLTPGKSAAILAIPAETGVTADQLFETIIHKAAQGALQWATDPEEI
jgi:cytosine/adenosine deaminase-related metal-dependent hydrolase